VDRKRVKRLFLLVACANPPGKGVEAARLNVRYREGGVGVTRENSIPLVGGRNVHHWINPKDILPEGFLAWQTHHPSLDLRVGLYLVEWPNPVDERIVGVDFLSDPKTGGVPILIGLSGELR
jgi:hypothetical protein